MDDDLVGRSHHVRRPDLVVACWLFERLMLLSRVILFFLTCFLCRGGGWATGGGTVYGARWPSEYNKG